PLLEALDDAALVRIGRKMSEIGKIDPEVLDRVVEEYLELFRSDDPLLRPTKKDVIELFRVAVREERAARLMGELDAPRRLTIWEKLSRLKPEMIAAYLENEHPQTIALILGNIDSTTASRVIKLLPEEAQLSVVMRMSKIERVPAELVRDIEEVLEEKLANMEGESGISFDGMLSVVEILKGLEKDVAKPILEKLREKDEELFSQVDRMLFVFEDLKHLSDRDIQNILKHISTDDLVKALKGASDEVAERFLSNMSTRAADMLREDMEVMGPIRLAEVEEAQQNILKVVRKLDDEGVITLSGGEEMV
ncbi:MAG: flagellar motor switch protein FliG, partial [Zetaproteobacteria bacterium]